MTVADNTSRNQYTATSGQTVFAYTFEIVDKSHIVVLKNGTTLSEGTDYTVSNVGNDNGGNVTLTSGATAGDILTLYRDMPYSRTQNYTNSGDFLASEVNADFDDLWLAGEQTNRSFSQSIRKPITDSDSISMELPEAADRANKFVLFDSTGAVGVESLSSGTGPTVIGRQNFTGNGSTTVFTLAADAGNGAAVVIYIDGVYQEQETYTVSSKTLTFTEAPPTNASIEVVTYKITDVGSTDANAVTYTPAGTGAVQTTVQTKLRESVSVKDFGAAGDGVTDDTAAIQAALLAGKIITFPAGTYLINDALSLNTHTLIGENNIRTIIKQTTDNKPILQVTGIGGSVRGFHLTYTNNQTYTNSSSKAIEFVAGSTIFQSFRDIFIDNAAFGIYMGGGSDLKTMFSCAFDNIRMSVSHTGIHINPVNSGATGSSWNNIYINFRYDGSNQNGFYGVYANFMDEAVFNQLNIESGTIPVAMLIDNCDGIVVNSLHLEQLTIDDSPDGSITAAFKSLIYGTLTGFVVDGCAIINNDFSNLSGNGYYFFRSDDTAKGFLKSVHLRNNTKQTGELGFFRRISPSESGELHVKGVSRDETGAGSSMTQNFNYEGGYVETDLNHVDIKVSNLHESGGSSKATYFYQQALSYPDSGETFGAITLNLDDFPYWESFNVKGIFVNPGTNSGGVAIILRSSFAEDGDTLSGSYSTQATSHTVSSQHVVKVSTIASNISIDRTNDIVRLVISRYPASGADTLTGNYYLIGAYLVRN